MEYNNINGKALDLAELHVELARVNVQKLCSIQDTEDVVDREPSSMEELATIAEAVTLHYRTAAFLAGVSSRTCSKCGGPLSCHNCDW